MRIVRGLVLAVAALVLASAARGQAPRELTVPNLTVTAPAVPTQPPYITGDPWKAFVRNPYFGRYRIEENRFAQVPCSQTRIAAVAAGNCLQGYRLTVGRAYMCDGCRCDMALDATIYTVGNLAVEAGTLIFDPYKLAAEGFPSKDCQVQGYPGYDQIDFHDMNQVTRRGANWHDLRGAGDEKSIAFTDGPHSCIGVRRPGPPWQGGYVYMLTASICRTDTADLQPDDVARALAPLLIRQYDPIGNLARARR